MSNFVIYTGPILRFIQVQFCKYMVIGGFKPNKRKYTCATRQPAINASATIMCERASERCESPRHPFSESCVFERKRNMKRNGFAATSAS